jgi:hypothetical protein
MPANGGITLAGSESAPLMSNDLQVLPLIRGILAQYDCQSLNDLPNSAFLPDFPEISQRHTLGRFFNGYCLLSGFYSNLYPNGRTSFAPKYLPHISHRFAISSLNEVTGLRLWKG